MLWFRWIVILWLLAEAIGYLAGALLAMRYDSLAAFYLVRTGAVRPGAVQDVHVPLASIAVFLARDVAWGLALLILAVSIWRWNRWGWWLAVAVFGWFLFTMAWGLVRSVGRLPDILVRFPFLSTFWVEHLHNRAAELGMVALMTVWLMLPTVRARFDSGVPAKAAG